MRLLNFFVLFLIFDNCFCCGVVRSISILNDEFILVACDGQVDSYSYGSILLGRVSIGSNVIPLDMVVNDNRIYVLGHRNRKLYLTILSINNNGRTEVVVRHVLKWSMKDLMVGSLTIETFHSVTLYLSLGMQNYHIIDTAGDKLSVVGSYYEAQNVLDSTVWLGISYIINSYKHLHIVNTTNPNNPKLLSVVGVQSGHGVHFQHLNTSSQKSFIIAFVVGKISLTVIDVSDPHLPNIISVYKLEGAGKSVLRYPFIYVSVGRTVQLLNVGSMSAPYLVSTIPLQGCVVSPDIAVGETDGLLVVSCGSTLIKITDTIKHMSDSFDSSPISNDNNIQSSERGGSLVLFLSVLCAVLGFSLVVATGAAIAYLCRSHSSQVSTAVINVRGCPQQAWGDKPIPGYPIPEVEAIPCELISSPDDCNGVEV